MTLLAIDYSARIEECVVPGDERTFFGRSLVHLLHEPFPLIHRSRLLSVEWQQIIPFLSQIGCDLESTNRRGQTPFLVAAACLNFRNIRVLSRQGVDMSAMDRKGRCAFHVMLNQDWTVCSDRASDLRMTIVALVASGYDPRKSSKWTTARNLWRDGGTVWRTVQSAFRDLGWTDQEINELLCKSQPPSEPQNPGAIRPSPSRTVTNEDCEASFSNKPVQSIENQLALRLKTNPASPHA